MKSLMDLIKNGKKVITPNPTRAPKKATKRTRAARITIKRKGKDITLAEVANEARLGYMTVYMRYKAGARDYKDLARPVA